MEILSKDMLDLLRDPKFRETLQDLLKQEDVQSTTVMVTIPNEEESTSTVENAEHEITIRRLST